MWDSLVGLVSLLVFGSRVWFVLEWKPNVRCMGWDMVMGWCMALSLLICESYMVTCSSLVHGSSIFTQRRGTKLLSLASLGHRLHITAPMDKFVFIYSGHHLFIGLSLVFLYMFINLREVCFLVPMFWLNYLEVCVVSTKEPWKSCNLFTRV